jgi:NADH-quinone oxidoreductase subunit C
MSVCDKSVRVMGSRFCFKLLKPENILIVSLASEFEFVIRSLSVTGAAVVRRIVRFFRAPLRNFFQKLRVVSDSITESLLSLIQSKLGSQVERSEIRLDDLTVWVARANMAGFFQLLKVDAELEFNMLIDVTAVDWMDERENRFEVVYHLLSTRHRYRLRIKIEVSEDEPVVDSVVSLWSTANYMEREAWDMYGIHFEGHPDLRRILLYEEFEGHPLRKDYPVQAKQPRIPLRHPEVRNTAVDMRRPELVQIKKRQSSAESEAVRS